MPFCLLFDLTVYFRLLSLNDGHTIAISRAVNSPLRSRLLPTQPWKVAEVEEAENAMSVTYKKVTTKKAPLSPPPNSQLKQSPQRYFLDNNTSKLSAQLDLPDSMAPG